MENQWSETATHAHTQSLSFSFSLSLPLPPHALCSLLNDLALGTDDEDSLRREPFLPFLNKRGSQTRPSFVIVPSSFCFCCTSRTRRPPALIHPSSVSCPHFMFSTRTGGDYSRTTSRGFRSSGNDTEIATSLSFYFEFIDISPLSAFVLLLFPASCLLIQTGYLRRLSKLPPPRRLEATS